MIKDMKLQVTLHLAVGFSCHASGASAEQFTPLFYCGWGISEQSNINFFFKIWKYTNPHDGSVLVILKPSIVASSQNFHNFLWPTEAWSKDQQIRFASLTINDSIKE
jgi:hypothetical protein